MRARPPRSALRLLASLCAACAAMAATPAPPRTAPVLEEQVEVGLQLVDVVVTDASGAPLRGLGPANFAVEVDGRERAVVSVDSTSPRTLPAVALPSAQVAPAVREPLWTLLVFDADHIGPQQRSAALAHAHALVRTGTRAGDRVAISVSRRGKLESLRGFVLASAIGDELFKDPHVLEGHTLGARQRVGEVFDMLSDCRASPRAEVCAEHAVQEFVASSLAETRVTLAQLRESVAALAALPGRKALVLFGDGFMLDPASIAFDAIAKLMPEQQHVIRSHVPGDIAAEYDTLLAEASRARVSVFAVRTGGDMARGLSAADRGTVQPWHDGTERGALPPPTDSNGRDRRATVVSSDPPVMLDPFTTAQRLLEGSLLAAAENTGGAVLDATMAPERDADLFRRVDAVYTLGLAREKGDAPGRKISIRLVGAEGRVEAPKRLGGTAAGRRLAGHAEVDVTRGAAHARVVVERGSLTSMREGAALALYYRLVDARGTVLNENYVTVRVHPGSDDVVLPIEFQLGKGVYVFEATVSDLVGHARITMTEGFEAK